MKFRTGFVTNSSSSSFIMVMACDNAFKVINELFTRKIDQCLMKGCLLNGSDKKSINGKDYFVNKHNDGSGMGPGLGWYLMVENGECWENVTADDIKDHAFGNESEEMVMTKLIDNTDIDLNDDEDTLEYCENLCEKFIDHIISNHQNKEKYDIPVLEWEH